MTTAVDATRLAERLAHRLQRAGVDHPVAAAVAIACRGATGRDLPAFAAWVGLPVAVVAACEAGAVAFGDLPAEVVDHHEALDLLSLADLDAEGRSRQAGATGVPSTGAMSSIE